MARTSADRDERRAPAPARVPPPAPGPVAAPSHPASVLRRTQAADGRLSPGDVLHLQRTLGNRAVGRILSGARAAAGTLVQRKKSTAETNGGVFTADPYEALADGVVHSGTGKKISGARMRLRFTPGFPVVGRVGLVQAVKHYASSGNARRFVKRNENDEKVSVDVTGKEKAFIDVNRLEGPKGKRKLVSNLPLYGEVPAKQIDQDKAPTTLAEAPEGRTMGSSNLSQTGSRTDKGLTEDAILDDAPHAPMTLGHEATFEVAAIALDGPLANTYLGTVRWGLKADQGKAAKLDPEEIRVVSLGVPSDFFMEAAEGWNAQKPIKDEVRGKEYEAVQLPAGTSLGPSSFEDIITPSGSAALGWVWLLDHVGHVLKPRTGGKDKVSARNRNLQRLLLVAQVEKKLDESGKRMDEIDKEVERITKQPEKEGEEGLKEYLLKNEVPKLKRERRVLGERMEDGVKALKALKELQLDVS
jgi:hypothetical protein